MIAALLAGLTFKGVLGSIWKGFCDFIATPIGTALIAGLIMFSVGYYNGATTSDKEWQTKWNAAEAQAELDRLKRDALVKAKVEAEANKKLEELSARKTTLEEQLKKYEDEDVKAPSASSDSVTDSRDDEWLSGAKRAYAKPQAKRGLADRLRAHPR